MRFNNSDELDLFEVEITNMSMLHIFSMGDFNARTQIEKEYMYIDTDDFTKQQFGYDNVLDQFNNVQCLLSNYSLDPTRASKDKSSNKEGNLLLEICKSSDLFILNGRCGKDKGTGNFTFRNSSIIDYSIASAYALKYV